MTTHLGLTPQPPGHPDLESARRNETIETLREAVRRNDLGAVEELLADDVLWFGNFPGGACHNREQVLATLQALLESGMRPRLEDAQAHGDQVLLQVGLSVEAAPNRQGSSAWLALTMDDMGRITELQDYSTRGAAEHDLALRAAGAVGDPSPASPVGELIPPSSTWATSSARWPSTGCSD